MMELGMGDVIGQVPVRSLKVFSAPILPFLPIVHLDIILPDLPSCRTRLIRTEYLGGVIYDD